MIEIVDFLPVSPVPGPLAFATIDMPSASGHVLIVSGRIKGRAAQPVYVRLSQAHRFLRDIPLQSSSSDRGSDVDDPDRASTFWSQIGVLGLPREFAVSLTAIFEERPAVPLAVVRGRHDPLRSGFDPHRLPLMITSLRRTGSTWLLHLLARHPAVLVHQRYPYEVLAGRYWLHMLKVLSEPADHVRSLHPDHFHRDLTRTGHHPYFADASAVLPRLHAWFTGRYVERLAAFCQEATEGYYDNVAIEQRQQETRYFAEKHFPDPIQWIAWDLYPDAREVFLVRDPRDIFVSMLAFNEQRGFPSFGRELVQTDEEWLRLVRMQFVDLVDAWRSRSQLAHLVRYEDLITNPTNVLSPLFRYLDVEAGSETVERVIAEASSTAQELERHRTAESAQASIGRWRTVRGWRKRLDAAFGDVAREFGYD